MVRRFTRPIAAGVCVLAVAAGVLAWQPEGRAPRGQQPAGQPGQGDPRGPGGPGGGRGGAPSVEAGMKGMNRPLRQLSQQIGDASKKDENLRLINDMQRGCATAKGASLPEKYLKGDDAAKAKLAGEFRSDLIKMMRLLLDIEEDIAAGKTAEASTKLKQVAEMRDHGHKEMGVKED